MATPTSISAANCRLQITGIALMCVLAMATVAHAASPLTLDMDIRRNEKGMTSAVAANPLVTAAVINSLLTQQVLRPCGVRSAHLHLTVDEISMVVQGEVQVQHIYPNGTYISDTIGINQAFAQPKGSIHQVVNPSCLQPAIVLNFFNAFDTQTVPVGSNLFQLPVSPFDYVDAADRNSTVNSLDFFSFDAACLSRCGLGEQFGQLPIADVAVAP